MEEIKIIGKLIFQYGGTIIMAILFVIIFLEDRKNYKQEKEKNTSVLQELSKSNNNIAESLNLLKTSLDNTTNEFRQHDERAIKNFQELKEGLIRIEVKEKKI